MDNNLELVNILLDAQKDHKEEILKRLIAHEKFLDKRFNWLDRGQMLLDRRMNRLEESTNHKVDLLQSALADKADKNELLTSFIFRVLDNKLARWVAGIGSASFVGWVVANHWLVEGAKFIEGLF